MRTSGNAVGILGRAARLMGAFALLGAALHVSAVPTLAQSVPINSVPPVRGIALPQVEPPAPPVLMAQPTNRQAWPNNKKVLCAKPDMRALVAEDAVNDEDISKPMRLGLNVGFPGGRQILTPADSGVWSVGPDGESIWRLRLESANALAMRVRFTRFLLPDGARLVMKGSDPNIPAEVYVGSGPQGTAQFWSMITPGDTMYLEYVAPANVTVAPIIEINNAVHIYRGPFEAPAGAVPTTPNLEPGILTCHRDVRCDDDIIDPLLRDAVGVMYFSTPEGGFATCTGTLLNDADVNSTVGWFLTADHCINTIESADSLIVFWFYQRDVTFPGGVCTGGIVPQLVTLPRSQGARIIGLSDVTSGTDVALLRLNVAPTQGQGYAGWSTVPPVGNVYGIHHPGGATKKIVFGTINPASSPDCLGIGSFCYMDVTLGAFQGGSSGSALFNTSGEVVGQLFGYCGPRGPSCTPSLHVDGGYGRFANSYATLSFAPYLANLDLDDTDEPNDSPAQAIVVPLGDNTYQLLDSVDYFRFTAPSDGRATITARYNPYTLNIDLAILNAAGSTVLGQAPLDLTPRVAEVTTEAGTTYLVRVFRAGGSGDQYELTYSFTSENVGDANHDGVIDAHDVVTIFEQFSTVCPNWDPEDCADITGDLHVGYPDLNLILRVLGYRRANYDDREWKREMKLFYKTQIKPIAKERRALQKADLFLLENARP